MRIHWNTFDHSFDRALDALARIERIMSDDDAIYGLRRTQDVWPRLHLADAGDAFRVEAEVPGVAQSDLEIQFDRNVLVLRGSRRAEQPEGMRALRRERPELRFERAVAMPTPVDGDRIEASLRDGVLVVTLPKAASALPRQIAVRGQA